MNDLSLLEKYALQFAGTPYKWGGENPISGWDCSGFVKHLLQVFGVFPQNFDTTAQGIYNKLLRREGCIDGIAILGSVSFYGKNQTSITHCMMCLDSHVCIGACGGGRTTKTKAIADKKNAFIQIKPIAYRKDFLEVLYPGY